MLRAASFRLGWSTMLNRFLLLASRPFPQSIARRRAASNDRTHRIGLPFALLALAGGAPTMELVDLADPEATRAFFVVNDDVMGGVSTSRLSRHGDSLVFSGRLRLEHGGGFAS